MIYDLETYLGLSRRKSPHLTLLIAGTAAVLAAAGFFTLRPSRPPSTISDATGDMVLVHAGKFLFGEKKVPITLPDFYVDKIEVTNAAYQLFCNATHHELPPGIPQDKPGFPVVNITIEDARAFARWAHKRLPNEFEWEKAARGVDGREYPWGNQPAAIGQANVGTGELRPAEAFPTGVSPFGALQMVGNAWEFVDQTQAPTGSALSFFRDKFTVPPIPEEPWYEIRGESFKEPYIDTNVIWDGAHVPVRWRDKNVGFRCVRDLR